VEKVLNESKERGESENFYERQILLWMYSY